VGLVIVEEGVAEGRAKWRRAGVAGAGVVGTGTGTGTAPEMGMGAGAVRWRGRQRDSARAATPRFQSRQTEP